MISIQHILVPIDFSLPSQAAVKYGRAFAENFGASLHLLHVIEDAMISFPAGEGAGVIAPMALDEIEKSAREQLGKVLTPEERDRFHVRTTTVRGSPSMEITGYAQAEKIDLIIMGTHGRNPIAHMLMGSVAEKVVRKAPCAVLIVRHPEHEFVTP